MLPLCQRPEWSGEAAPAPAAARRCTSGAPAAELPSHLPSLAHPDTFPPCDLSSPHYVQVSAEGGWRREGRAAQEDRGQSGEGKDVDMLNISVSGEKIFQQSRQKRGREVDQGGMAPSAQPVGGAHISVGVPGVQGCEGLGAVLQGGGAGVLQRHGQGL